MPLTNRDWFHRVTLAAISSLAASIFAVLPLRAQDRPARLLYFTHSAGYRHDVIPRDILKQIGAGVGFEVTASEDVAVFTPENLQRYGAVMFFTTGELPMSNAQQRALTDFIRTGNGFLGVHSATDTFYQWPEYLNIIGGYFDQHPWHQTVTVEGECSGQWTAAGARESDLGNKRPSRTGESRELCASLRLQGTDGSGMLIDCRSSLDRSLPSQRPHWWIGLSTRRQAAYLSTGRTTTARLLSS